jgi:hypothetical protein
MFCAMPPSFCKVDVAAITTTVKQEFAAKEKAKAAKTVTPKPAVKAPTAWHLHFADASFCPRPTGSAAQAWETEEARQTHIDRFQVSLAITLGTSTSMKLTLM